MKLFQVDGKFYQFLNRFYDLVKLNLLWLLFSLPIITFGASTTAAYSILLKMADNQEFYIARTFVREFKSNFKQGTILGLIFLVATYALYLDYELNRVSEDGSIFLIVVGILSAFIYVFAMLYAFPLLARYENTLIETIQNSMRISRRYFGRTLLVTFLLVLEFVVFNFNAILQGIGVFFGGAFGMYTVSSFAIRIFHEIENDQAQG